MAALSRAWEFVRPFTLVVPAFGMLAGGLMAWGADPRGQSDWSAGVGGTLLRLLAGMLAGAALNGFSNGINQIYDLEVDRVNKPHRLLPSGRLSLRAAWLISWICLAAAVVAAAWIGTQTLLLVAAAAVLTWAYSAPPLRTKARGFWANLTIAIPRGTLLPVAGWSTVKTVQSPEPWWIGLVMGAYILGAATTKDFSDIEGDRAGGCATLPVRYGIRRSILLISPCFVLPFMGLALLSWLGCLQPPRSLLAVLGGVLAIWGGYIVHLLLRTPPQVFLEMNRPGAENHPSWKHMYWLSFTAQVGLAAAYWWG
ncbi:MAG: hypothetical protein Kow001_25490 [Acidobacteriota bacterium]